MQASRAAKNLIYKKMGVVMKEFKKGKLKMGGGKMVKNRKQAIAIGLSKVGLSKKK